MHDVAIIGVGLHPFGRFGEKSAMEMGADAIHLTLEDAGIEWSDVQFGFGGSWELAQPDAVTSLVGLTGIPFTDVFNACATAASAIEQTARTIRAGDHDIGVAVGMDNLTFLTDEDGNKYLYTTFTKEQLEAAPAYDKDGYAANRDGMRLVPHGDGWVVRAPERNLELFAFIEPCNALVRISPRNGDASQIEAPARRESFALDPADVAILRAEFVGAAAADPWAWLEQRLPGASTESWQPLLGRQLSWTELLAGRVLLVGARDGQYRLRIRFEGREQIAALR